MKVAEIREERNRQVKQWGGKHHDRRLLDEDWCLYINRQIRSIRAIGPPCCGYQPERRKELYIHIAALAVAAIEAQE